MNPVAIRFHPCNSISRVCSSRLLQLGNVQSENSNIHPSLLYNIPEYIRLIMSKKIHKSFCYILSLLTNKFSFFLLITSKEIRVCITQDKIFYENLFCVKNSRTYIYLQISLSSNVWLKMVSFRYNITVSWKKKLSFSPIIKQWQTAE